LLKIGKIQHLNINSLRYKFDEIKEVLTDNIVDLLIISETKLDESFNDNLFSVDGYKVQRRDRNQYGGGLLTYIRSDFSSSRKQSSVLKKELLKIGKIQFAQYQLSDDVDKRWYSSIGRSIHLM
jgi:exonuclease III